MTLKEAIALVNASGTHVVVLTHVDSCAHFRRKPPRPVANPNALWCGEYADWYQEHVLSASLTHSEGDR